MTNVKENVPLSLGMNGVGAANDIMSIYPILAFFLTFQ